MVIHCAQGKDNTVGRGSGHSLYPGTIQWVGALFINCVQGRDNAVGRGPGHSLCPG